MKLDFYEADILAMFLNENRKAFVECAQDFDDYSDEEALKMLESIRAKTVREMFRRV